MARRQLRRRVPGSIFDARHDHERCVFDALDAAQRLCAARGARLTELRRRVLVNVWRSHRAIGAYAILDRLRDQGRKAAPLTVYRALAFLSELGLVHRIESLNAYVGCPHPATPHAGQHLICTACGNVAELKDRNIAEVVAAGADDLGFTVRRQMIEVTGLCAACRELETAHG